MLSYAWIADLDVIQYAQAYRIKMYFYKKCQHQNSASYPKVQIHVHWPFSSDFEQCGNI